MTKHIRLLIGLTIALSAASHAQWVQTNGPFGAFVYDLCTLDTQVYVGTSGGLFRTTVHDTAWQTTGLAGKWITSVLTSPSGSGSTGLFASAYGEGIYKSTDSGSTWTASNPGLTNLNVYCLDTTSDAGGPILLAGTVGAGVYRSTNHGATWNSTGWLSGSVYALGTADSVVFAGTTGGIYRSINYGQSWITTPVLSGLMISCIRSAPDGSGGTVIFAGTFGNGMYRSVNYGATWTPVNIGGILYVSDIVVHDTDYYAMTVFGIRHSTAGSSTWSGLSPIDAYTMAIHDDGAGNKTFFAGFNNGTSGNGVFRSYTNGLSWSPFLSGLTAVQVTALAVSSDGGNVLFAGTPGDGGAVFRSFNQGQYWESTALWGIDTWSVQAIPDDSGGTIYLASGNSAGTRRSADTGATWTLVYPDACLSSASIPISSGGRRSFLGSSSGASISTDYGLTWTPINAGLTNTVVSALVASDTLLFAGTNGGVFVTSDYGMNWTIASGGITNLTVRCLAVSNTNLFAGTAGGGIFYSSNNGTSWSAVNTGLSSLFVNSMVVAGNELFAGTNGGVFQSSNMGASWTAVNNGLAVLPINELAAGDSSLYAATQIGVWRRPLSQLVTGISPLPDNSNVPNFLACYPNPVRDIAHIDFYISQPGPVSLKIYNEAGSLVSTVQEGKVPPGLHRHTWDAGAMSNGIYFCRLQAGSYSTWKMILVAK